VFQEPARTEEEIAAQKPLAIPPESVLEMGEDEWYARVYRRDARQLTVRAVVTGTILGFFLSFTNIYIGLKTGWFLGVNLSASILVYAIWSAILSAGATKSPFAILEANCAVSTASAAGYATGHALVTAIPALLLLSVTETAPGGVQLHWYVVMPWVFFLAVLGTCLAIPMKRNMINRERLRFPSGTASAVTLQGLYARGSEAMQKARALFVTLAVSACVPILKELEIKKGGETLLPGQSNVFDWIPRVLPESWTHRWLHADGKDLHPSDFMLKLDHGVALIFGGILVGLRITTWMVISGLVLAIVITPPAMEWKVLNTQGVWVGAAKAGTAWKEIGVWCGAPMLVASGLVSFATQWRTILRAFGAFLPQKSEGPYRQAENTEKQVDPREVEVPAKWFVIGVGIASIGIITIAQLAFDIPFHLGVLAVLMSFVLALVACRATGESDITPGGPLGKIVQLTYGILMPQSTTANLMTASITSNASLASADLLNDLKGGYLLGANPRRQFLAQAMGIGTGALGTVLCYFVLVPDARVLLGTETKPPPFPVPGAQQWRAVAEVFKYGLSNLHPMSQGAIKWGIIVGVLLALLEAYAPKDWKKWLPSATGIGLGLVLPFFYPLAMFTGAALAAIATAIDKRWAERYLVAIAAGGMAGESIVGVIVQAINNFVIHR
jgi:OPT family oligopeptide transporter